MSIRSFTIHVTKEAIDQAVQKDSRHCMIAEAIRLRGASSVHVTAEGARFNYEGTRYFYPLPAAVAEKLIRFDKGQKIDPFDIVLNGNTGMVRPVIKKPHLGSSTPRPQRAKRGPMKVKKSPRRYNGLAMIEVKGGA